MKPKVLLVVGMLMVAAMGTGRADIPVIDAPQLDQHSKTAATKIKLAPVVSDHAKARTGIHCATTTGQKGAVKNNAAAPDATAGAKAVTSAAPSFPTTVDPAATGAALATQTQGSQTATVVAGVVGNQQTVTAASADYAAQGGQVGSSATVMAAWDANTSVRVQNGLSLNTVIGVANLLAEALNIANLATVRQSSQAAGSLTYPRPPGPSCPATMSGRGSIIDPCVAANSVCLTAAPRAAPSAACVERRFLDSYGNVIFYLATVQELNAAQGN